MTSTFKKSIITSLSLIAPGITFAQGPTDPCGSDPFDPSPCDLPLDGYVVLLCVVAGYFAMRQLRNGKSFWPHL